MRWSSIWKLIEVVFNSKKIRLSPIWQNWGWLPFLKQLGHPLFKNEVVFRILSIYVKLSGLACLGIQNFGIKKLSCFDPIKFISIQNVKEGECCKRTTLIDTMYTKYQSIFYSPPVFHRHNNVFYACINGMIVVKLQPTSLVKRRGVDFVCTPLRWRWQSGSQSQPHKKRVLAGNLGSWISVCNLILTQLDEI